MKLPENRLSFKSRKGKNRLKGRVLIISVFAVSLFLLFNLYKEKKYSNPFDQKPGKNEKIMALWESRQYDELIKYTENLLLQDGTDFNALVFYGFANFYEGASHFSLEERIPFIDRSVLSLRKALIFNKSILTPQIYYVLGKAYYHKGYYYSDLAAEYLEKSLSDDYEGEDTYEYLGLVYTAVGNKERSAECFEKAVEKNPSDLLYLALAQVYIDLNNNEKAEEYLIRTANKTGDNDVEEKSYFLLAQIYENKNDLIKMEDTINKIININPRSADAYYKLGELYEKSGDRIKARSEWRKALRIDPEHYGARLKLF